ncbi:redox-sensing transcriptional repressor Rex [Leadbettera azotonutricia]|uniref:redox-sensing transcriptional repressor Rex n=1 Tax=Leadbettera azotonutricia TaxID=150829 RepID=UPI0005C4DFC1|nr:redox-sensing transcriptional repressor Rex [Leadbettera azotonutricia]
MVKPRVPAAPSVRRLPSYLHVINNLPVEGEYISGTFIAEELNLDSIQVRKDLAITGVTGKPKKGYRIEALRDAIENFLGWDKGFDAVLVGVGNLGSALMGYSELVRHGLHIIAAFDNNPRMVGKRVHGIPILNTKTMDIQLRTLGAKIAILSVPAEAAQETADVLIRAGITGLWNFTNVKLKTPEGIIVQKEDISSGYAMLCVRMKE